MDIKAMKGKEAQLLRTELKRTIDLCKRIYSECDQIIEIKKAIELNDMTYAEQLFSEWDLDTQKSLMIAPTKGGPFTTKEREILARLWKQVGI